VKSKSNYFKM